MYGIQPKILHDNIEVKIMIKIDVKIILAG